MNNYFIMLISLLLITCISQAQSVQVIDIVSLQPIENVSIYTNSRTITAFTNSNGVADLSIFKDSTGIVFQHPAYHIQTFTYQDFENITFKVLLTEKTYKLDEVVISASKFVEKKSDVPQQIQVITSRDLAFINQQTSADVLQNSGNVMVQKSQQGGGSPVIRGFEANKVLIVVDGVRMNNAIYRGGHLQNILTLDNSMLDKIEVVFGPGSVAYGSDALGGVMHFFTKKPTLARDSLPIEIKTNVFTRYATAAHEKTGHADVNLGYKRWAFLSSFTVSDFDDLRQGNIRNTRFGDWGKKTFDVKRMDEQDQVLPNNDVNLQKSSGYAQYDFMQKALFKPYTNITHILNIQYSTSSAIPRYDRLTLMGGNGKPRFAEWYYGPQKRLFGSYQIELLAERGLYNSARVIATYQRIEESRIDRRFEDDIRNNRIENVDIFTLNLDLNRNILTHEIRYGLETALNDVRSTAFADNIVTGERSSLDTRYPDGGSYMRNIAAYLTHTWEISPKVILTDGLRYNYTHLDAQFKNKGFFPFPFNHVTQKSGAVNGNLGLIYKAAGWHLSALGSSGFRAPNLDDLSKVFESVPGNIILPNAELKPEYTYNGEIGIAKSFAEKVHIAATGFYTFYKDAITIQPATFEGSGSLFYNGQLSHVKSNVNAQKAYIYGFNANVSAAFTSCLSISSTLNYTYGRIRTDSTDYPLDHIPPLFGKTSIDFKTKQFRGEFFLLYHGWKHLKDYNVVGEDNLAYATSEGSPTWYTLNIRMAYQINKFLQGQLAVENLLDRNYRVFSSGISAPGRNLIITLRARI